MGSSEGRVSGKRTRTRGSRRSSRGTRWVVWTIREPLHPEDAENAEGELMRKSYSRFSEAVTAAQELGSELCGGITRNNGKYTLRRAGTGGPYYTDKAQVSWVFGEATMVTVKPTNSDGSSEKASKKASPKKQTTKKETTKTDTPKKAGPKKKVTLQVDEPETSEQEVVVDTAPDDEAEEANRQRAEIRSTTRKIQPLTIVMRRIYRLR